MIHTRLKPTTRINIDFHPSELHDTIVPEESKKIAADYVNSETLAENQDFDIMIMMDDSVIFGYDYLHNNKKLILPEINPVTIFYSNARMSYGMLNHYKEILLTESSEAGKIGKVINLNHFGTFFQLAVNCIINLQATIESFVNLKVLGNFNFLDKNGKPKNPNIHDKIDIAMPIVMKMEFNDEKNYTLIKELIKLRNDIIHLKPDQNLTNTKYKIPFRNIIDFNYQETIMAVKNYINFYEPNLLEECACGNELVYDICQPEKK